MIDIYESSSSSEEEDYNSYTEKEDNALTRDSSVNDK